MIRIQSISDNGSKQVIQLHNFYGILNFLQFFIDSWESLVMVEGEI